MLSLFLPKCRATHAALTLGLLFSSAAFAQNAAPTPAAPAAPAANSPSAPPPLPAPNPAAEKALQQHFQAIFSALEGKSTLDTKNFSDDFNKQVNASQLKQVLGQVHQTVGNCRIAGQLKGPVSFVSSYLLQCDKGFVPMDIAIEETAPYRVHSLLIRPGYAKL